MVEQMENMNEIQEEICRLDEEEKENEIFEKFLSAIDNVVRSALGNNEKTEDLIQELTITFLEIRNGIHKEKELSPEDQRHRSRVRGLAIDELKRRDYGKDREAYEIARKKEVDDNRKKGLKLFPYNEREGAGEVKKAEKETHEQRVERLLRSRKETETLREIKSE